MQVKHTLARSRANVCDHPIVVQPGVGRHPAQRPEQRRQEVAIGIGQVIGGWDMPTRDRQQVGGCPRVDVAEYDHLLVFMNPVRRNLSSRDLAEQAIRVVGGVTVGHVRNLGESIGLRQGFAYRSPPQDGRCTVFRP